MEAIKCDIPVEVGNSGLKLTGRTAKPNGTIVDVGGTKIGGEELGKINYFPVICIFIACIFYFYGHKCRNSS